MRQCHMTFRRMYILCRNLPERPNSTKSITNLYPTLPLNVIVNVTLTSKDWVITLNSIQSGSIERTLTQYQTAKC